MKRAANIRRTGRAQWAAAGLCYTEVLMACLLIAVLFVSAMRLFANLGRSQQGVDQQDIARRLALEMITEIKTKAYADPVNDPEFGPGPDEAAVGSRSAFDDIDDYHGWSAGPPQDAQGNELPDGSGYTRGVQVCWVQANDFSQPAAAEEGFKRVTITVSFGAAARVLEEQVYVIADAPVRSDQE
ncbi:MAG: hypothetical protein JW810_01810 [Sedimentisphaerales bacterium]|nr:hypothetical protein [Sedimentisphaerales bacterium]